jgi:hypothetical protein
MLGGQKQIKKVYTHRGVRTHDLELRKHALYPAELGGQQNILRNCYYIFLVHLFFDTAQNVLRLA